MSKDKKLSPKQKKIAAMAGDPNRIEGEDFQKLKTMKADEGVGVETARKHKKYIKDKYETAKGYLKEMFDPAPTTEEIIKNMPERLRGTSGAAYFSKMARSNPDRLTKVDQDKVNEISEKIGANSFNTGGSVMAKGNKLARSKPTKLY